MFMKRYSYKAGIIFGLLLAAVGGLLFFPAAMLKEYWAYLCIFFIIATGMCFLETAANPYVTVLGAPETAPRRLNLAQSFNGLGAFIAAMFLSKLILSGTHYTRETLPVDYPGGWQAYIQLETDAMKLPYLILALLLLAIAVVFVFSKLPKIGDEGAEPASGKKEKLIDFDVLKRSHLLLHLCRFAGRYGYHFLWTVHAGLLARALDWYGIDGQVPSAGYVAGVCFDEYPFVWCRDAMGRNDRTVCDARHLFLYVYHVSYTVLFGTERTRKSDKERFGLFGNGNCR